MHVPQRSFGMEISCISGVTLPTSFLILQEREHILALKLHAYLMEVTLLLERPLNYSINLLPKLRVEVEQH